MDVQLDSQAYLALAIDAGKMAIWDFDVAWHKLEGSRQLYRLFGFGDDETPSLEEIQARYFPGERDRLRAIEQAVLDRNERYGEIEFRCVWPDGSVHWLMLRAEIFRNSHGSPMRYLGVLIDVTQRRSAEADFAKSEALKSAMMNASLDCIITIDGKSRIREWNPAAELMFGIARGEALGRDLAELIIPEPMRAAHHAGLRHYLLSGQGAFLGRRIETEALRGDGSKFPVELTISSVRIADGEYFTAFMRDITGRKEEDLRRQLLTRELAHRIKNTLALVQTIVGQTLRQAEDITSARTAVEQRLSALAQAHDVLISADWQGAPIHEVVEEALRPYRTENERFGIRGGELLVDARQALALSLAVNELATNAIKYGALSNETGRVDLSWAVEEESAERSFLFEWTESGGPPVERPTRAGFGTRMIERSLAGYFQGEATLRYERSGFSFRLRAPLSAMTEATDVASTESAA